VVFALVGIGMAAWAPLVPYAKARLSLHEGTLGALLLCLGVGSFVAMPLAGGLVGQFGCRKVIVGASAAMCAALPVLALADNLPLLAAALLWFGAALGIADVAMNVQAVAVEQASGRAMMSGFHAFFSIGGMAGAGGVSLLLWAGAPPFAAVLAPVGLCLAAAFLCAPQLLPKAPRGENRDALFAIPSGVVLAIGCLCFVAFLTEGAMLDWSGVFLVTTLGVSTAGAGLGYAVFSVAMAVGRVSGDRIVNMLGPRSVLVSGALCAMAGLLLASFTAAWCVALTGFALVGFGAANIVPILYSTLGRQNSMPTNLAISTVSTLGYAGIFTGPALIGGVAHALSLGSAFVVIAALLLCVAASVRALSL
jgi:predicted MFS family arabinose efflux permease